MKCHERRSASRVRPLIGTRAILDLFSRGRGRSAIISRTRGCTNHCRLATKGQKLAKNEEISAQFHKRAPPRMQPQVSEPRPVVPCALPSLATYHQRYSLALVLGSLLTYKQGLTNVTYQNTDVIVRHVYRKLVPFFPVPCAGPVGRTGLCGAAGNATV